MRIAKATQKMIFFYDGHLHDTRHFLKVLGYARTIGILEGLDAETQETLELAAIVHDIAIPLCREKYNSTAGSYQELEGGPLAAEFYQEFQLSPAQLERICYLVAHHHTVTDVDGLDYRILLEADFLVNADEGQMAKDAILAFRENVFRTKTGTQLLNTIYKL